MGSGGRPTSTGVSHNVLTRPTWTSSLPSNIWGFPITFESARASRHNISQAYILFALKYIWQTLEMTSRTQSHPQILLISIPWVIDPQHNMLIKCGKIT